MKERRLIDANALNLDYEVEMADDWKTAHEIANVVKYAPTIQTKEVKYFDEDEKVWKIGSVIVDE